ncbi:hypothetical protein B0H11DRAFT_1922977 [Mycena galericulata]|nr:hypothetical protein B0H11DRAFT_1922977 [Mycena galericulata]
MTQSISVTVHSIEDWALWLPELSLIRCTLAAPLPAWCATGPYPSVSSGNLPLVSEIPKPATLLDTDCCDTLLSEAFNLVLSHVSDIRSLIVYYGPSRSAVPFVSSLMRVLAQMCSKEAITLTETPFVRPRTRTPYEGSLDGMATFLACHSVESFGDDSRYITEVQPRTVDADTAVYPMSVDSESDSSVSSIDVPLEAHVLPGRGKHLSAVLPFLCVADKDNIVDLVSSVACQRHVWGIPQPAVGFDLWGTIAKLTVSWVDSDTRMVHVASPGTALGVFDLTNVAQAVSFAQLVLGLSQDFAAISACAKTGCQNNRFCWRSDGVSSEHSDQDRVSRRKEDMLVPENPKSHMSSSRYGHSGAVLCWLRDRTSMAAKSATGGVVEETPQIQTWMFDRLVQTLGRIPFNEARSAEQMEINGMLTLYGEMCDSQGVNSDEKPPVDLVLTDARDALLTDLRSDSNLPLLSSDHQALLFARLSSLLSATVGASLLDAKRSELSVYEAESRHAWDSLLYHFYVLRKELISPHVLLEHTIHFARNIFADTLATPRFVAAAKDHHKLCVEAQVGTLELDLEVGTQAHEAVKQAMTFHSSVKAMPAAKLTKLVQQRSVAEPRDGKCDAILFISIPSVSLKLTDAIIQHMGPSSSSSKTGILDDLFYGNSPPAAATSLASFKGHLILPHATVEHKKRDQTTGKALNQGRMYLISLVSFYSALGIQDLPFYCLVTSGTLGAILMGWQSSTQKQLYLVERNVRTFDLSSPRQAFYFAAFLLRLREDQAKLMQRVREKLSGNIDLDAVRKWNKSAQIEEE